MKEDSTTARSTAQRAAATGYAEAGTVVTGYTEEAIDPAGAAPVEAVPLASTETKPSL